MHGSTWTNHNFSYIRRFFFAHYAHARTDASAFSKASFFRRDPLRLFLPPSPAHSSPLQPLHFWRRQLRSLFYDESPPLTPWPPAWASARFNQQLLDLLKPSGPRGNRTAPLSSTAELSVLSIQLGIGGPLEDVPSGCSPCENTAVASWAIWVSLFQSWSICILLFSICCFSLSITLSCLWFSPRLLFDCLG